MTDKPESTEVELQRGYEMIHRDATAHIAAMKARQWTITHYALLILIALFYFTNKSVIAGHLIKFLLIIGVIVVLAMWHYVTWRTAVSMREKRQRLKKIYELCPKPAKDVYGQLSDDRGTLSYDIGISICQGAVVWIGSLIVIASIVTEKFLSS